MCLLSMHMLWNAYMYREGECSYHFFDFSKSCFASDLTRHSLLRKLEPWPIGVCIRMLGLPRLTAA